MQKISLRYMLFVSPLLFFISGCSSQEKELETTYQLPHMHEMLLSELQSIHSLSDAKDHQSRLEAIFTQLSLIMITKDASYEKTGLIHELDLKEKESSRQIQNELNRLLAIPGIEEVIKKSQEPGFRRLEKYTASSPHFSHSFE